MHPQASGDMEKDIPRDHFQAIVHQQSDGVVVIGKDRKVFYHNPAASRMTGSTLALQVGGTFDWDFEIGRHIEIETFIENQARAFSLQTVEGMWKDQEALFITIRDITERKFEENLLQQALEEAQKHAAGLEAIRFVAEQLNQAAMFEEAIQSGLETILTLVSARAMWTLLPESDGKMRLVVIYPKGSLLKSEKRSLTDFSCESLNEIFSGEVEGPRTFHDMDCLNNLGLPGNLSESFVSVPLGRKDHLLGVLNVSIAPDQQLSSEEMQLLSAVGSQLSVAVERAIPFAETQEVLHREENLKRISRTISGALDLPTMLQNPVQIAREVVNADAVSLGLVTPNGQNLTFLTHAPDNLIQPSLSRGDDILWNTIQSAKSVLVKREDLLDLPPGFAEGACHMILAPISSAGQELGLLCLYNTSPEKEFNVFDHALVESLAQQTGLAMQNAQLFFEIQQLTMTDSLTGLYNQSSFNNLAVREVERAWRYHRPLTLIISDVDGLEKVNQVHGIAGGDAALKKTANLMTEALRRVDILSRHEMDTFLMLLPETEIEHGMEVAERLRDGIEKAVIEMPDHSFSITISLGVAGMETAEVLDLDTLIDRARLAMEGARSGGRRNTLGRWTS